MRTLILATASALALTACNFASDNNSDADGTQTASADNSQGLQTGWKPDPMASRDGMDDSENPDVIAKDDKPRPMMQAQVVLDRIGFAPGVIDGKMGMSTKNAITGFQTANDMDVTGELDDATKEALAEWSNISATRVVTIPQEFANDTFEELPEDPQEKAKLDRLGYESLEEKLAERFHTTVAVLRELNPNGRPAGMEAPAGNDTQDNTASSDSDSTSSLFRAGQQIRVPNIGGDRIDPTAVADGNWRDTLKLLGVGTDQPKAAKVVVDKSDGILQAFDKDGKLVAQFTATMGSEHDPLPLGDWGITGVAYNPTFNYNPELFWDADDSDEKAKLPPGPNGPVGVVWIDLTKEHYGIHGTPAPETIGRAQSHGCVRLTNWDVARLAQMVSTSTKVVFQA